jgi:hypothetical protein
VHTFKHCLSESELLSLSNKITKSTRGWVWEGTPVLSATWEVEVGRSQSETSLGKCTRHYLINKLREKRTGGLAKLVERLPSKYKALSSNPSTTTKQ